MSQKSLADLREDYRLSTLDISDVLTDPVAQFRQWFEEAQQSKVPEPNALTLATATSDGRPSARVVLLKGLLEGGFVFYTNFESQKGREMDANPRAAMVFNWLDLQRQVRIEGQVRRLSEEQSIAYFQSRPKGSQIGAWASPQSQVIDGRQLLEENVQQLKEKYASEEVLPKPPHWGGYVLLPEMLEFWQGRSSRLHDRIRYDQQKDGQWKIKRLAP
ncbi:MAG: pyridoxamine 5'-phosphate oxidase [Bacteroidota bacterium]